jgi:hypothetical protein
LVGVLVAVVAVGIGVLNAAAALAHKTERMHRAFPGTVHLVDVSSSGGSIRVVGGEGSETTVDALVDVGLRRPSHREELEGDRLVIRSEDCGILAGALCSVDYTIHVPQGIQVTAASGGGGITVWGVRGNVDLSSSGGEVRLRGATTEEARVHSSGGDVTALGLVGASIDAASDGGDVTLSFAAPPNRVVADSRGGSVVIEVPDTPDAYRVLASSSGGDATTRIRTDPTSSRLIRASSSGGDVSVRYHGD